MKLNNIILVLTYIFLNIEGCVFGISEADRNTNPDYPIIDCAIEFNRQPLKEVMEKIANQTGIKYFLEDGVDENRLITFSLWGEYWMPSVFYGILHGKLYWDYKDGVYYITTEDAGHLIVEPIDEVTIILKNKNSARIRDRLDEIGYSTKDEPGGYGFEYISIEEEIVITGLVGTISRFRSLIKYLDEDKKRVGQSLEEIANGLLEKAKERKREGKSFRAICGMAIIIYKKIGKEEMILRCKEFIGEKEIEVLHDYKLKDYLKSYSDD